jgi:hypothetical protein
MTIWYILCSFGTLFPILVSCTKKNLASLLWDAGPCVLPFRDLVLATGPFVINRSMQDSKDSSNALGIKIRGHFSRFDIIMYVGMNLTPMHSDRT